MCGQLLGSKTKLVCHLRLQKALRNHFPEPFILLGEKPRPKKENTAKRFKARGSKPKGPDVLGYFFLSDRNSGLQAQI